MYVYIYIYREREREREIGIHTLMHTRSEAVSRASPRRGPAAWLSLVITIGIIAITKAAEKP